MRHSPSRSETVLLSGVTALVLLALVGPAIGQPGDYHHFADQRALFQFPMALDVLSNLPFALAGMAGWIVLQQMPAGATTSVQRAMARLFFAGLLLTAAGSAWYHLAPDHAGLAIDRCAMAVAFAGLTGVAAADRVSERAGAWLGGAVLLLGPSAASTAFFTGNVLPWAVLQFGGMTLVILLACGQRRDAGLHVRWGLVMLAYAAAKLLEMNDQAVFDITGQWVSGHTLKHVVGALAAVPVISALCNSVRSRQNDRSTKTNRQAASR